MAKKKPSKKTVVDRKELEQRAQKLVAMYNELQRVWLDTLKLIDFPLVESPEDYFEQQMDHWCEDDKDHQTPNPEKLAKWLVHEWQRQEREERYLQLKREILALMVDLNIKELHADGTEKE